MILRSGISTTTPVLLIFTPEMARLHSVIAQRALGQWALSVGAVSRRRIARRFRYFAGFPKNEHAGAYWSTFIHGPNVAWQTRSAWSTLICGHRSAEPKAIQTFQGSGDVGTLFWRKLRTRYARFDDCCVFLLTLRNRKAKTWQHRCKLKQNVLVRERSTRPQRFRHIGCSFQCFSQVYKPNLPKHRGG